MATLTITYTPDGKIKKEITYKNETFDYTMIPNDRGKTADKIAFAYQVREKYPNEPDDVFDALDALDFADEDEIEEHILTLSRYE